MRLFSDDSSSITDPFLRHAYKLAMRGEGTTSPNPMVGCVIVNDDRVVGEGWHERAGGPHAEVVALDQAAQGARGATVYVTLEPCAHDGRTPPCADALIARGVSRVVIGMPDPTDTARGGAERLRSAGVDVTFADDPAPFEALNEGWLTLVRTKRPWVTVKIACTLDGKVAAVAGARAQISGEDSRPVTMKLRAVCDAVLVGARTAVTDDPALTSREADGTDADRQPLRVVLTRDTDPSGAALFSDGRGPSALLLPEDTSFVADDSRSEALIRYARDGGLDAALDALGEQGIARVLVEPGPTLFTALWSEHLIDELIVIHAGVVFGESAPGMLAGAATGDALKENHRMRATECAVAGDDVVTVWRKS
jgi:diaminohydroxyphosphoribosylaminopyrimidine deaminase / 5-amino-6-(5-phosphoribosylamino)uracil reductase